MSATRPLGELLDVTSGYAFASERFSADRGMPLIRIRDVMRSRTELKFDAEYDPRFVVQNGDLLVSMDGEFRIAEWQGGPALLNQRVCRVEPKPDRLDPRFLLHFLPSELKKIEDRTPFVTVKHLSAKSIKTIEFPTINLDEQRRIAAILDKADAIRRKRERALTLADDFLRSVYVHTVGKDHPDFPEWEPMTIESLAADHRGSIRSGPFGSALLHSEFVDEGIAVLGIDNAVKNKFMWAERRFVTPEKYEELRRYRVFPKDVIITIMGTTGRSAVVPDDIPQAITTKHLASITCNLTKVVPEFLSFAIHSDPLVIEQIRSANKGAIMDGLNLGIIRKLQIKLPPMHQQVVFAKAMTKTHEFIRKVTTPIGSGNDLFAALSQRAFAGDL